MSLFCICHFFSSDGKVLWSWKLSKDMQPSFLRYVEQVQWFLTAVQWVLNPEGQGLITVLASGPTCSHPSQNKCPSFFIHIQLKVLWTRFSMHGLQTQKGGPLAKWTEWCCKTNFNKKTKQNIKYRKTFLLRPPPNLDHLIIKIKYTQTSFLALLCFSVGLWDHPIFTNFLLTRWWSSSPSFTLITKFSWNCFNIYIFRHIDCAIPTSGLIFANTRSHQSRLCSYQQFPTILEKVKMWQFVCTKNNLKDFIASLFLKEKMWQYCDTLLSNIDCFAVNV